MGNLTKNFSRREFKCPCCGKDDIDEYLVDMLQSIRDQVGPVNITSGVRCKEHNKAVGGKPTSSHLKGLAVDIKCAVGGKRFLLLDEAFGVGFSRIGIGKSFIHLDIDPNKTRGVIWTYYP